MSNPFLSLLHTQAVTYGEEYRQRRNVNTSFKLFLSCFLFFTNGSILMHLFPPLPPRSHLTLYLFAFPQCHEVLTHGSDSNAKKKGICCTDERADPAGLQLHLFKSRYFAFCCINTAQEKKRPETVANHFRNLLMFMISFDGLHY